MQGPFDSSASYLALYLELDHPHGGGAASRKQQFVAHFGDGIA